MSNPVDPSTGKPKRGRPPKKKTEAAAPESSLNFEQGIPRASMRDAKDIEQAKMMKLLERAEVVSERVKKRLGWDLENRDPAKHYCLVPNESARISDFEAKDYEVVVTGRNSDVETRHQREDGTHRKGDQILMQVDLDFYEALKILGVKKSLQGAAHTGGMTPELEKYAREAPGQRISVDHEAL